MFLYVVYIIKTKKKAKFNEKNTKKMYK